MTLSVPNMEQTCNNIIGEFMAAGSTYVITFEDRFMSKINDLTNKEVNKSLICVYY